MIAAARIEAIRQRHFAARMVALALPLRSFWARRYVEDLGVMLAELAMANERHAALLRRDAAQESDRSENRRAAHGEGWRHERG